MKIQYKFLVLFVVAFVITIVPNLFLLNNEIVEWLPIYLWTYISIARFVLLIGLFFLAIHFWVIKPLNQIAHSLAQQDPDSVDALIHRKDEIGKIGILLQHFFSQRKELDAVLKENSKALESVAFSEAKSRSLLNAIPDLMFRISLTGNITDYHVPDPTELLLPPDKFMGKQVEEIMPSQVATAYRKAILDLEKEHKSQLFEYTLHMPDGSQRAYEAMVSATEIGDYLIIIRNITIRKEAEIEISRMLLKQKELNQLKSHFISLVSHEFRTPISAISSNVQLLARYEEKWSHDKKAEVLRRMKESISKMITLLEEVSLISKDQTGALTVHPEEIHLNEFVNNVIVDLRKSSELPVQLELQIDQGADDIYSDKELLRQILSHLLSNAGKFSPQEKPVRVTVTRNNNHIEMIVSDQGIGIPDRDLEHLFQPFHRCSNSEGFPGTGLGMSIVKRCVDLLKGSIRLDSKVNEGTTFRVSIPLRTTKTTDYEQDSDY
ncbi:MAG: PAS domain-containing sensor histidine kinase [Bacteroidales bacterium]|nr:PAS domain-containing sensor histidine kinase [Bacteroidales bacterium]